MRVYSVWLNSAHMIEVNADDVDLESNGNCAFWNFKCGTEKDAVTVAGFPFAGVDYFVSHTIIEGTTHAVPEEPERTEGPRLLVQQ